MLYFAYNISNMHKLKVWNITFRTAYKEILNWMYEIIDKYSSDTCLYYAMMHGNLGI